MSRTQRFSVPGHVLVYPLEVERVSLVDRQADDLGDFKGMDGSKVETGAEEERSEPQPQPCPAPSRTSKHPQLLCATWEFRSESGLYHTLPGAWPKAGCAPPSGNAGNPVRE